MDKIKFWVNIMTASVALGFFDGFLDLGISEEFYMLIGLVLIVAVLRLSWIVNKTEVIK